MKIHLGVIDQPYSQKGGKTTVDVARILEAKYQVYQRFFDMHRTQFADDMANSVANALTNIMAGAPPGIDPFASAMQDIEQQFRLFIQFEDITQTGAQGVPTQAALDGRSSRFKYRKGPRRESFRDTGLYEASFKAWVTT